ncbi:MAG: DUF2314 domain-containing protein [Planctomycetia bacterium]|nr:DUF2314 domain-containing protein [Planctomycetia bacterium]
MAARIENDPKSHYAPPDERSLQYFGRGLAREQAAGLQDSKVVLILEFGFPKERVWNWLRAAGSITHSLTKATGGLIWDEATREVFSPDAWEEKRLHDWVEEVPDITQQIVIHAYRDEEHVRAITLGMAKCGLADIVIEGFPWSLNRNMGHIINLFAQSIAEGATCKVPGDFDLNFRAIRNSQVRDPQVTTLMPNATGVALLYLQNGIRQDGDPDNRLVEITFQRGLGPDIHAKQDHVLSAAFGFRDSVTNVKHDEAIEAASRAARRKLPELRATFEMGLAPGEFILVKAPFRTADKGREFMWVEISSWKGSKITGLLQNQPRNVPDLHAGQVVEVSEADVFDYIRRRADGTSEGNETGKLMEKRTQ